MKKEEMISEMKEKLLKTQKELSQKMKEQADKNQAANDLLLLSSAVHIFSSVHLWKKGSNKLSKAAGAVSFLIGGAELLSKLGVGMSAMNALANAIDRSIAKKENEEAPQCEEVPLETVEESAEETVQESPIEEELPLTVVDEEVLVEETPVEEAVEDVMNEEPAVPAMAEAAPMEENQLQAEDFADGDSVDADEDGEDGETKSSATIFVGSQMKFIDIKDKPELYQEYLEKEKAGEVQLVTRYKTGFKARVIQSQGNVQEYYSAIKNALLSYKGVKGRMSWNFDSYHCGRDNIAKINVKNKTIYLYLALDPSKMADSKYGLTDMSGKKKFDDVQMLLKIRGDRKFKYALELINNICSENLNLKPMENAENIDYTLPYQDTETLVELGEVKKMVAAVPVNQEQ